MIKDIQGEESTHETDVKTIATRLDNELNGSENLDLETAQLKIESQLKHSNEKDDIESRVLQEIRH